MAAPVQTIIDERTHCLKRIMEIDQELASCRALLKYRRMTKGKRKPKKEEPVVVPDESLSEESNEPQSEEEQPQSDGEQLQSDGEQPQSDGEQPQSDGEQQPQSEEEQALLKEPSEPKIEENNNIGV